MSGSLHFLCGQPNMGLSLHSPSSQEICCGWDAPDRLPVRFYPLVGSEVVPRLLFACLSDIFCPLGSRNVGEILVLVRGRMLCCYPLDFCRLSRMRCLLLALRDFAPQTSGGPLYESLLLYAVCRVAGGDTQIVFCRVVVNDMPEQSVRSVLACIWIASRSYEQRFPVCVMRRPACSGWCWS
jgi:hypothetical protein